MNQRLNNFLRSKSVLPSCIGFALLVIGISVWTIQQRNVDILDGKIQSIKSELEPERLDKLEILKLKKDILVIEKDKTIILNGIGATIAQALGAVVLGATAYVGYQNFRVGADNLRINEKNLRVSEEKQVTERFSKGIEHLGSDKIDIRLGGIYALEQIANDSSKYHWTIMEILSAFVREKRPNIKSAPESDLGKQAVNNTTDKILADVQAALTVISRRKSEQYPKGKRIDLRRVYLVGLEIQNANFSYVDFRFSDLSHAELSGADFSNGWLDEVNFCKASLDGVKFCEARLVKSNLSKASISGNPNTNGEIEFADFSKAKLTSADFSDSNLCQANLSETILYGANFSDCRLNQVILENAFLGSQKFNNDDLPGTNFTDANLSMAGLNNIKFRDSNFLRTNLNMASLDGTDLSKSINLTLQQIVSARTYENIKLPDYLES